MAELTRKEVIFILNNTKEPRLGGLDLSGLDLSHLDFSNANCSHANFSDSNLVSATFYRANLEHTNFEDANLIGSNFASAKIRETIFDNACLDEAGLSGCYFNNVSFRGASLKKTLLRRATFEKETVLTEKQLAMAEFDYVCVCESRGYDSYGNRKPAVLRDKNGDLWVADNAYADHPSKLRSQDLQRLDFVWTPS